MKKSSQEKFIMVDRIVDEKSVYVVDDFQNEFLLPAHLFDAKPKEGDVFSVLIKFSDDETKRRKSEVLSLINDLTSADNNEDFSL